MELDTGYEVFIYDVLWGSFLKGFDFVLVKPYEECRRWRTELEIIFSAAVLDRGQALKTPSPFRTPKLNHKRIRICHEFDIRLSKRIYLATRDIFPTISPFSHHG